MSTNRNNIRNNGGRKNSEAISGKTKNIISLLTDTLVHIQELETYKSIDDPCIIHEYAKATNTFLDVLNSSFQGSIFLQNVLKETTKEASSPWSSDSLLLSPEYSSRHSINLSPDDSSFPVEKSSGANIQKISLLKKHIVDNITSLRDEANSSRNFKNYSGNKKDTGADNRKTCRSGLSSTAFSDNSEVQAIWPAVKVSRDFQNNIVQSQEEIGIAPEFESHTAKEFLAEGFVKLQKMIDDEKSLIISDPKISKNKSNEILSSVSKTMANKIDNNANMRGLHLIESDNLEYQKSSDLIFLTIPERQIEKCSLNEETSFVAFSDTSKIQDVTLSKTDSTITDSRSQTLIHSPNSQQIKIDTSTSFSKHFKIKSSKPIINTFTLNESEKSLRIKETENENKTNKIAKGSDAKGAFNKPRHVAKPYSTKDEQSVNTQSNANNVHNNVDREESYNLNNSSNSKEQFCINNNKRSPESWKIKQKDERFSTKDMNLIVWQKDENHLKSKTYCTRPVEYSDPTIGEFKSRVNKQLLSVNKSPPLSGTCFQEPMSLTNSEKILYREPDESTAYKLYIPMKKSGEIFVKGTITNSTTNVIETICEQKPQNKEQCNLQKIQDKLKERKRFDYPSQASPPISLQFDRKKEPRHLDENIPKTTYGATEENSMSPQCNQIIIRDDPLEDQPDHLAGTASNFPEINDKSDDLHLKRQSDFSSTKEQLRIEDLMVQHLRLSRPTEEDASNIPTVRSRSVRTRQKSKTSPKSTDFGYFGHSQFISDTRKVSVKKCQNENQSSYHNLPIQSKDCEQTKAYPINEMKKQVFQKQPMCLPRSDIDRDNKILKQSQLLPQYWKENETSLKADEIKLHCNSKLSKKDFQLCRNDNDTTNTIQCQLPNNSDKSQNDSAVSDVSTSFCGSNRHKQNLTNTEFISHQYVQEDDYKLSGLKQKSANCLEKAKTNLNISHQNTENTTYQPSSIKGNKIISSHVSPRSNDFSMPKAADKFSISLCNHKSPLRDRYILTSLQTKPNNLNKLKNTSEIQKECAENRRISDSSRIENVNKMQKNCISIKPSLIPIITQKHNGKMKDRVDQKKYYKNGFSVNHDSLTETDVSPIHLNLVLGKDISIARKSEPLPLKQNRTALLPNQQNAPNNPIVQQFNNEGGQGHFEHNSNMITQVSNISNNTLIDSYFGSRSIFSENKFTDCSVSTSSFGNQCCLKRNMVWKEVQTLRKFRTVCTQLGGIRSKKGANAKFIREHSNDRRRNKMGMKKNHKE